MKIYREELFGGILYDDQNLSYRIAEDEGEKKSADKIIPLRRAPGRSDILSAPIRVYFELTTRCNLACSHCFADSHPGLPDGMPRSLIFELLEDMRKSGVINVRFTGGEPTARDDWSEICAFAHDLGLIVSLNTNGIFDDPAGTVKKIAALGLEQVTVSIDGLEETHDALRGKGAFNAALQNIERLHDLGLNLRITTVITRDNIAEIPDLVDLASRFAKVINFVCLRPIGRSSQKGGLMLSFEGHHRSAQIVRALRAVYPDLLIIHSDLPLPEMQIKGNEYPSAEACIFSSTPLAVSADGSFWPHHYLSHQAPSFRLGRFPEQNIDDIWLRAPHLDYFRSWSTALLRRCKSCREYNDRCAGMNFEMEIAKLLGNITENPYCANPAPVPRPYKLLDQT
jgi:MoaA/NifB/PqqE/SkfB family radical SAM enzyme